MGNRANSIKDCCGISKDYRFVGASLLAIGLQFYGVFEDAFAGKSGRRTARSYKGESQTGR